jgi:malate dehydrogenase (oxaloacetate-decarboxylating)(NADP+)
MTDLAGVVFEDRTELMDDEKRVYAQATPARTLGRSSTARRPIWASQRAAC